MSTPLVAFAGNRPIARKCLKLLLDAGITPVALLVADGKNEECADTMLALLPNTPMLRGKAFREGEGPALLHSLKPDYLLSIHFPYIIPRGVLAIPTVGTLNLHPAYLPWNRCWNTASWAIWEQTPAGATLHWVDEGLDTGDIALQEEIPILPTDTAHTLYQRILQKEVELFRLAIPLLKSNTLPRIPQRGKGTAHRKGDIETIRCILPTDSAEERDRRIRALTTNNPEEAAYIEENGKRLCIRYENSLPLGGRVRERW